METVKHGQLELIAWLRWRLFVNGLRTTRGKANLASKIILGALLGSVVLGLGLGMGIGAGFAISHGKPLILAGEFWFVFLIWLVFPILISGFSAESDPASLLRFPLRYSTFVLLAFAHGILDHVAVAALFWLTSILVGISVVAPGALPWAIPALGMFALFNLLLNRTIFAWLSRWLAQRRTREILAVVLVLVMLSFQLIGPLTQRYGKELLPAVRRLASVSLVFPPGMAAAAVTTGHARERVAALVGLLAYSAVLAWLLSLRLRAEYRGENLSEGRRASAEAPSTIRAGWDITGLSPTVAALLEKDLRYLLRNTMAYLSLLAPLLIVLLMSLNRGPAHPRHPVFWRSSTVFFPICVGYVMLSLVNFLYNCLGYDGLGLPMLLAAPVRFRDVLAAKNLLYTVVFAAEVVAVFFLVQWAVGPTPPLVVAVTLAGALWALLMNLSAGNLVSVYFPVKLNPGQMRRQQQSGFAIAASLGAQLFLGCLAAGIFFFSRWMGHLAWSGVAFLAMSGIAWVVYRRVIEVAANIAIKRREVLMAELSRPG